MLDLSSLNKNQLAAVTTSDGPVIVVAGAGTGKTRVLTTRIAYLVDKGLYQPHRILAITFTNKAANEMKSRVGNMVDNKSVNWIGTYHSICLRILREDISKINRMPSFGVIDEEDQQSIVREIYSQYSITKNICTSIKIKKALDVIGLIKYNKIDINNASTGTNYLKTLGMYTIDEYRCIRLVYNEYQKKLNANNLLDFDDLLLYTENILTKFENIREKWQNRFQYILVDEFQDTNGVQFNILKLLINPDKPNIFVVGDPDQSIYKWRGAYEWIFKEFRELYPKAKLYVLNTNYRSTKNILLGSNKLISNNFGRIEKELVTNNQTGNKIFYYAGDTQDDEGSFVANKILELIKQENYKHSDIAVLYRSNYLSRFVEENLILNNIPYKIFGGIKFYQRREIKDLLAYMKLTVNNDEISIKRIINVPRRNIGETTISKIDEYCLNNNISFWDALGLSDCDWNWKATNKFKQLIEELRREVANLEPSKALEKIIVKIDYIKYLISLDLEDKNENIKELANTILSFEKEKEEYSISEYLQDISLYTDNSELNTATTNSISLMTIHVAKGLEFKVVFLVGFSNSIFPPAKSNDYQEERRIAYVAMTRAMEQLFITYSNGFNFWGTLGPSMFLKEIGTSNLVELHKKYKTIGKADLSWYNSKSKIDFRKNYEIKNVNYKVGDVIIHTVFGSGTIIGINDNILTIAFKAPYGVKSIIKNHTSLKRLKN